MAKLAARGSVYPAILTSGIAVILGIWALYALSGAGLIRRRLPFLRPALVLIAGIYLARGILGIPVVLLADDPYARELRLKMTFMVFSSAICVCLGLCYAFGAASIWRRIMSKVFVNIGLSLDGYMAPEGMTMENYEYKNWGAKWGAMMAWALNQRYFRENLLKLGPGGETGPVNDLVRLTAERIGANIMGKRMFDQGERAWPEEAPFRTPVYVLTHEKREPWVRPGGTTFYFINDGPEHALELARQSAGSRDIRISGGADVIQQYLNLGVVDELEIALAPVLFGGGRRLFENLREPVPQFRIDRVLDGPAATHLRYVRQ